MRRQGLRDGTVGQSDDTDHGPGHQQPPQDHGPGDGRALNPSRRRPRLSRQRQATHRRHRSQHGQRQPLGVVPQLRQEPARVLPHLDRVHGGPQDTDRRGHRAGGDHSDPRQRPRRRPQERDAGGALPAGCGPQQHHGEAQDPPEHREEQPVGQARGHQEQGRAPAARVAPQDGPRRTVGRPGHQRHHGRHQDHQEQQRGHVLVHQPGGAQQRPPARGRRQPPPRRRTHRRPHHRPQRQAEGARQRGGEQHGQFELGPPGHGPQQGGHDLAPRPRRGPQRPQTVPRDERPPPCVPGRIEPHGKPEPPHVVQAEVHRRGGRPHQRARGRPPPQGGRGVRSGGGAMLHGPPVR